ncbi:MAG: amidohydrolase family protein [Conexivisphaera sp.]
MGERAHVHRFSMAFIGEDYRPVEDVYLEVDDRGYISSIGRGSAGPGVRAEGVAIPAPIDAHVHTGDYALAGAGLSLRLEDLVAPPNGLKHRLLASMGPEELELSISGAISYLRSTGSTAAADFREGGLAGVLAARRASSRAGYRLLILGRPGADGSFEEVLRAAGPGLSSPLDHVDSLRAMMSSAASVGKIFAAHVAETRRSRETGDLEAVLEAGPPAPGFIVHGTFLSEDDLMALAEARVGLVACPRANSFFSGASPPIAAALRAGVELALGTDNTGWVAPDMWREMEAALRLLRSQDPALADPRRVLRAATLSGARVLGMDRVGIIEEGWLANLVVLDGSVVSPSMDPLSAAIIRGGPGHIRSVISGWGA